MRCMRQWGGLPCASCGLLESASGEPFERGVEFEVVLIDGRKMFRFLLLFLLAHGIISTEAIQIPKRRGEKRR